MTDLRTTAVSVTNLEEGEPESRITGITVELLQPTHVAARLTAEGVEIFQLLSPTAKVTASLVEVLMKRNRTAEFYGDTLRLIQDHVVEGRTANTPVLEGYVGDSAGVEHRCPLLVYSYPFEDRQTTAGTVFWAFTLPEVSNYQNEVIPGSTGLWTRLRWILQPDPDSVTVDYTLSTKDLDDPANTVVILEGTHSTGNGWTGDYSGALVTSFTFSFSPSAQAEMAFLLEVEA